MLSALREYNVLNLIPTVDETIIGINITPRTITCSWIEPTPYATLPYELKAYKHLLFEANEKKDLTLFNPTKMQSLIDTFLELNDVHDASIVMALSGEGLVEKQIMLARASADLQSVEEKPELTSWHYYCLQDNPSVPKNPWYCCGISRAILLQYQLLAIQAELNVTQITTPTMALLKAYRYIKNQSGAATPEAQPKTNILDFINLNGHVKIRSPHDHAAVVESFGLFLLGSELVEA